MLLFQILSLIKQPSAKVWKYYLIGFDLQKCCGLKNPSCPSMNVEFMSSQGFKLNISAFDFNFRKAAC